MFNKDTDHPYNTRRKRTISLAVKKIQKKFRREIVRNRFARLKKYRFCSICLEKLHYHNAIFLKDCDHIFHKYCIYEWVNYYDSSCPNCRTDIEYNFIPRPSFLTRFCRFFGLH